MARVATRVRIIYIVRLFISTWLRPMIGARACTRWLTQPPYSMQIPPCRSHRTAINPYTLAADTMLAISSVRRGRFLLPSSDSPLFLRNVSRTVNSLTLELSNDQLIEFYRILNFIVATETKEIANKRLSYLTSFVGVFRGKLGVIVAWDVSPLVVRWQTVESRSDILSSYARNFLHVRIIASTVGRLVGLFD